ERAEQQREGTIASQHRALNRGQAAPKLEPRGAAHRRIVRNRQKPRTVPNAFRVYSHRTRVHMNFPFERWMDLSPGRAPALSASRTLPIVLTRRCWRVR